MGQRCLLDTNIIIDFTANLIPENGKQFISRIIDVEFNISIINKIEVLGFNDLSFKMRQLEAFLDLSNIFPLDETVSAKTIYLRRMYKKLKLGDAIIAATCLVYDFVLLTRNTKDFINIEGLNVINPFDM
ncbi:MAG: type II toxin-antitoxin system VapC family toxin [Mariniphaga sp.]